MTTRLFLAPSRLSLLAALAAGLLALAACKSESKSEPKPELVVQVPASLTAAKSEIETTLRSYEALRALLADDRIEPAAGPAGELAAAAAGAAQKAPANLREPLEKLGQRAVQLKEASKGDAAAARKAFGDVSQALVALLRAEPALRQGLNVFECPMAQGYKQWVQPGDKLENPYMGKSMLDCGAPGKWDA